MKILLFALLLLHICSAQKHLINDSSVESIMSSLWKGISVATASQTTTASGRRATMVTSDIAEPPDMPQLTSDYRLPSDFRWGVATSAYQVEGAVRDDLRSPSIWDVFSHTKGFVTNDETGDVAANHYYLFRQDIDRLKYMGVKYYSFSISWSRVLPLGRRFVNRLALRHYLDVALYTKAAGMEPVVSLHHGDMPYILQQRYGGWTSKEIVAEFKKLAEVCFELLTPVVKHWFTIDEPQTMCELYYRYSKDHRLGGKFHIDGEPRNVKYNCMHNALRAHAVAADYFHTVLVPKYKNVSLSIKQSWAMPYPHNISDYEDIQAAKRLLEFTAGWGSNPLYYGDYPMSMRESLGDRLPQFEPNQLRHATPSYYSWNGYTGYAVSAPNGGLEACISDKAHPLWPECADVRDTLHDGWILGNKAGAGAAKWLRSTPGLFDLGVKYIWDQYKPTDGGILISEFGTSPPYESQKPVHEAKYDTFRVIYFASYLEKILKLVNEDGIKIIGAWCWSALDGFEWSNGYGTRFGLDYVDFDTQARHFKKSFFYISEFFRHHIKH